MPRTARSTWPRARWLSALILAGCSSSSTPQDAAVTDTPVTSDAPVAETLRIPSLTAPIEVTVDRNGWPHIRGTTMADVIRAQGYLQARDRLVQMELFRRNASGTLADIIGTVSPTIFDGDIAARVVGHRRTAQAIWDAETDPTVRAMLTAHAEGITAYITEVREGRVELPRGTSFLPGSVFQDWTPVDTLTVVRLQHAVQSYDSSDANTTAIRQAVIDHFEHADATTAPAAYARRGYFQDLFRFSPSTETTTLPYTGGRGGGGPLPGLHPHDLAPVIDRVALRGALDFQHLIEERFGAFATREVRGSNEWAVQASATTRHFALLASDPHVTLPSPSFFWGCHLTVTGAQPFDAAGSIIPGVPGILIGFTHNVAWGLTNAYFDQTDLWAETVTNGTGGAPSTVRFMNRDVPIETFTEMIPTGAGAPVAITFERVPHHGIILPTIRNNRIVPRTGNTAISMRWTGNEVTHELTAIFGILNAHNATEARAALSAWGGPSLNWTIADSAGNVTYSTNSYVPLRTAGARSYDAMTNPGGTMPCAVLPGDGTAEWTGRVPAEMLPQGATSDARPFIANANNDQAGYNQDNNPFNDPVFLTCSQDPGFRAHRIETRLAEVSGHATADDMESIQADHVVEFAGRMRPFLMAAMARLAVERTTPGTNPDLTAIATATSARAARLTDAASRIAAWSLQSPAGVEHEGSAAEQTDAIATMIFHQWTYKVQSLGLGDEAQALGGSGFGSFPSMLFLLEHPDRCATLNPTTMQSVLWDKMDTPAVETRDAILVEALDLALTATETLTHSNDPAMWLWGNYHRIRFNTLLTGLGAALTIPGTDEPMYAAGYPRHGGFYVVDASFPSSATNLNYGGGPGHRLVVEMDPAGPHARIALPGGQSIDPDNAHHRDEAALWRVNRSHPVPFSDAEVAAAAESRLRFTP